MTSNLWADVDGMHVYSYICDSCTQVEQLCEGVAGTSA